MGKDLQALGLGKDRWPEWMWEQEECHWCHRLLWTVCVQGIAQSQADPAPACKVSLRLLYKTQLLSDFVLPQSLSSMQERR